MTESLTGSEFVLRRGDARAHVVALGAHLRAFTVGGREVILPFEEGTLPRACMGATLLPWPNRLRDGLYTWDGRELQLALSEPERGNAIHGLGSWRTWEAVEVAPDRVTLELALAPELGYPFLITARLTYALTAENELSVELTTTNRGAQAAPYGVGFHPWLSPGPGPLDECEFSIDAADWVRTDERLLPVATEPLPERFDHRAPRPLGETVFDDAFGAVTGADGRSWARLRRTDGATTSVWMDGAGRHWQVCSGDFTPIFRAGLAVEPMTCVADAFRTGDDLIRLEPGASHTIAWGLRLD